jgi:DNA-directed RNA polymerase specialized sigma24 family protein
MSIVAFVIPADYEILVRDFSPFVAKVVQRYNNVPRHAQDILQDVWMHLVASDVLAKFQKSLVKGQPTMTGAQAAAYCDVSFHTFSVPFYVMYRSRKRGSWFPTPIEGGYSSQKAVWSTLDIIKLRDMNRFRADSRLNPDQPLPEPPVGPVVVTRGRFEAYLTTCIHNHFANFCRTRERRDQDVYLAPREDGIAWESGIVDCSESPEECADLRIAISKLGDSGRDVLALLDQGYTLTEACSRVSIPVTKIRMVMGG